MAADKQNLAEIFNLNIGKKYLSLLVQFVEKFSETEDILKENLTAKDYAACFKNLELICRNLRNIHADDLADEFMERAKHISVEDEVFEAFVSDFLSRVSMLSIDIQMAIYNYQKFDLRFDKSKNSPVDKNSILAVDDVAFFLNNMKAYLRDTPYKLTCITSGEEALRYLENHSPALFLLDIEMVGMDGYELAAKIKERGIKTPIIFITGKSSREHIEKAVKVGAVDFVTKPINGDILLRKVQRYMRQGYNL